VCCKFLLWLRQDFNAINLTTLIADLGMDISCVSSIMPEPTSKKTHIDETMMAASFLEPLPPSRQEPPATPEKEPDATALVLKMPLAEVLNYKQCSYISP
jgi:hypothetical protein